MANLRDQVHPVISQPVAVRAWAALPASGSEEIGTPVACAGWDWAAFFIEYQRGTAVWYQIEVSPYAVDQAGVENWFHFVVEAFGTVVPAQLNRDMVQIYRTEYAAQFGNVECIEYGPIHFARLFERFRIRCGDTNTVPGSAKITATFHTG